MLHFYTPWKHQKTRQIHWNYSLTKADEFLSLFDQFVGLALNGLSILGAYSKIILGDHLFRLGASLDLRTY